jgi:hypothetical protein
LLRSAEFFTTTRGAASAAASVVSFSNHEPSGPIRTSFDRPALSKRSRSPFDRLRANGVRVEGLRTNGEANLTE